MFKYDKFFVIIMPKIFLQTSEPRIAELIRELSGEQNSIETLVGGSDITPIRELCEQYGQIGNILNRIDPDVIIIHPNDALYIPGPSRTDPKIAKHNMIKYMGFVVRHGIYVARDSGRIIPILAIGDQEFRYGQKDVSEAIRKQLIGYHNEVGFDAPPDLRWYFNLFRPKGQTKFTPSEVGALRSSMDYALRRTMQQV